MSSTLPDMMYAISIPNPGRDSGELVYGSHPLPSPKPHEVLIRVSHAGVNRADVMQRQGLYPPPEGASPLPGLEVSGHIAAMGENVTGWKIGDAVCALLSGGGYAEYAVADAGHLLHVPNGWSMAEAAALPEAIITVWMALQVEAKLKRGETLLLHGAASGIGMIATQYAKHIGAEVIATAGTDAKCAAALGWGASRAVNYREEDFVTAVTEHTKNHGADVILDTIGGDYIARNFASIAKDGRLISLAFLRGPKLHEINFAPMLTKRILWKGTTLRARKAEEKTLFIRHIIDSLGVALEAGYIKPRVDKIAPLSDAKKAHLYMEDNLNIGKIILAVESAYS